MFFFIFSRERTTNQPKREKVVIFLYKYLKNCKEKKIMEKAQILIHHLLEFQNNVKVYHWLTHQYPRHKATDKLFKAFTEQIDRFVEVFMGKYGRFVSNKTKKILFRIKVHPYTDIQMEKKVFQEFIEFLNSIERYLPAATKTHSNSDLLTIRDEMLASVHQTLYLFSLS